MIERVLVVPEHLLIRRVKDWRIDFAADVLARVFAVIREESRAERGGKPLEVRRRFELEVAEQQRAVVEQFTFDLGAMGRGPLDQINVRCAGLYD